MLSYRLDNYKLTTDCAGHFIFFKNIKQIPTNKKDLYDQYVVELPKSTTEQYRIFKKSVDGVILHETLCFSFWRQISKKRIVPIFNLSFIKDCILKSEYYKLSQIIQNYRLVCRSLEPLLIHESKQSVNVRLLKNYFFDGKKV